MAKVCLTPGQKKKFGLEGLTNTELANELRDVRRQVAINKKNVKLSAIKYSKAYKQVFEYNNVKGQRDAQAGFNALIYRDRKEAPRIGTDGVGWGANIDSKIRGTNAYYQSQLYDMMEGRMVKVSNIGKRKKLNRELVNAVYGTTSDNRFGKFAQQWGKTTEAMRQRFNRAGGDIKKLDDWNLPQRHSSSLLKKHGFDKWYNAILDTADLERMELTPANQKAVLEKMYHRIVREGLEPDSKSNVYGKSKIANRHQEQRFIHFKDADSWTNYNEVFSDVDAHGAMMDHITMLSNEIALMETLGPNPGSAIDSLGHAVNAKLGNSNAADVGLNAYANLSGRTNPHNESLADTMNIIRNWTSFAKLPLAVLSAPPDLLASAITANYNGIPMVRVMMDSISILSNITKGGLEANRKMASDLLMNLDFMIDEAHSAGRFMDVGSGGGRRGMLGLSSRAAAHTVRLGGLNHWTVANKMSFHFNFMKTLADADLASNEQMIKTFKRYGLDDNDLSIILRSNKMDRNGTSFLDPNELTQETAEKVAAMVNAETKVAVPEADARVRGLLNQGTRRGTAGGETLRLITMFKTFPMSMIMNQWARALHGTAQTGGGRAARLASLFVGTTIMGAGIVQLKRIVNGEEPVEWGSKKLWNDAMIQGGTLSILGDVFATEARTFGSLADMAAGPALGTLNQILWSGIAGTMDDAKKADADFEELAREAFFDSAAFVTRNFAYGNIFATKLIWQRYVTDELKRQADPDFDFKKMRREFKDDVDYNQEKWW